MLVVLVFLFYEYPIDLVQAHRPLVAYQLAVTRKLPYQFQGPCLLIDLLKGSPWKPVGGILH